jgi:ribosomal-protein-alanine N-acetyltransferase
LILRPFVMSDARSIQILAGDREIADTSLSIPHPYPDGMAEAWIAANREKFESGNLSTFAILRKDTRKLIGAIGLVIDGQFQRAELGYWIARAHWNQGYCTEAGQAILGYGFTKLFLHRIFASHFRRNPASGRVLQKLGMKYEGRAREHVKKWEVFEDLELYGIIKDQWERSR